MQSARSASQAASASATEPATSTRNPWPRRLVAGRVPDRDLVLDEQQPRARLGHAGASSAGRTAAGRVRRTRSPPAVPRAASTVPPIASARPRTIVRPTPMPPDGVGRGRAAVEAVEQAPGDLVRHARAVVLDLDHDPVPGARGSQGHRRRRRRVAGRVLHEVGQALVEERRIGLDRRQVVAECDLDGAAAEQRPQPVDDRAGRVLDVERLAPGVDRAGLDPAQVEERPDHPVEPDRLRLDRRRGRANLLGRAFRVRVRDRAGRGPDPGQRRAEVVGHGVDERALERRVTPGHLGLDRLRPEHVALDRERHLVGGQGEEADLDPVGRIGRGRPARPQAAERRCHRQRGGPGTSGPMPPADPAPGRRAFPSSVAPRPRA